jgi:uncharacterized protein YbgA (DUF1722 family)
VPASVVVSLLRSWALRFKTSYLLGQSILEPYPRELVEITDSGKGRNQ